MPNKMEKAAEAVKKEKNPEPWFKFFGSDDAEKQIKNIGEQEVDRNGNVVKR